MTVEIQGIKDTFYRTLRDRVAAGNAGRTIVVRGVVRPAVLVVENELPGATVDGIAPVETFCLRWTTLAIEHGARPLVRLGCELRYGTDGSPGLGGMDRGRALAALDRELSNALGAPPRVAAEMTIAEPIAAAGAAVTTATGTNIFWGEVQFGPATIKSERSERAATVEVFGYGS